MGHAHENDDDTYTWFTAISAEDGTLNGGNYYLPYDVTLTNNITIDSEVTLCLNGHILRGNGNGSVITINSDAHFTLCDCSKEQTGLVTGGSGIIRRNDVYGGGVYVYGTFIMNGGTIAGNNATIREWGSTTELFSANGGGVYIASGAIFIMNGGEISDNTAEADVPAYESFAYGGGVYVDGTFTMNDGTITGNDVWTADDANGGGVYVNGTFTMNGGTITGNTTEYNDGGGIFINGGAEFTMENGTIAGNTASDEGGGVYVDGTFTMENGEITGNTASDEGGGVIVSSGTFTMSGGTIAGNMAYNGGGVYLKSGANFTLEDGTISGNSATSDGGGVYVISSSTFNMSGGYFGSNSIYKTNSGTVNIYGGYFASDPASYVSEGYINGSTHTVVQLSDENHYGDEDYLQGYPYAVYLSGQTPDYAVEDVNATYGTNYTPNVSNNIHNAGITYSYISGEQMVSELPSVVGQHNVTAAFAATVVTDDDGTKTYYPSDTETFTVTISPVITTTSLEDATYGTEYNQTLGINPAGSATWSITSGSLPDGLNLNESTGVISGTPMDVGGRYIFTVCATVNGISTEQEFSIMLNKASQSAPAANEGYIIDYSAETITILDGYEVYTAQDSGTQIISGSITNYIGQTVYIRLAETDTHNLSGWTEVTISARPNTPSSVTGSYAVSTTDDTKFVYTITAIEGAEYSKDGTSWQKSNVFDGITPESTVTFYARIAATDSSFVSTAASVEVEFNKLAGSGTVEITGWTEGESANAPSPTSTTNGTANVTYLYVSTDGAGYSSEQAPTNAGSYCVTATFAETAVYAEVTVYCDFTIAECMAIVAFDGKIEYCATVNEAFDYANELETYADGEGADANGRAIITLQSNVGTPSTLTVDVNKYITLDLNGYVLEYVGSERASVITVNGDFELNDSRYDDTSVNNVINGTTYHSGVITGTGYSGITYGGGVYVEAYSTFTMTGGAIAGNSAMYGGGVYVRGTFTMENGTIAGNSATDSGGGVYVGGSTFIMKNGEISGNTALIAGGGVYANGGTFTMENGEISGNQSYGVYVVEESTFNMKGGYFGDTLYVAVYENVPEWDCYVYISGGYFADDDIITNSEWLTDEVSNSYTAVNISDDDHYGDTGYVDGYPYAVYKLVAMRDTVYYTNDGASRDFNGKPLVCDENGDFYITATYADGGAVPQELITISYKLIGGTGDYTTTAPTNAGTYYIGVNISAVADGANRVYYAGAQIVDDNYFTFTINKIKVAAPEAASGLEYTGKTLTGVAVAENMNGIYTVTGGSATNANDSYIAKVELVDSANYEWADPEFDGTVSWSIAKRELTADMFQVTGSYFYTGAGREATYTFSDDGGNLTAADFEVSYSNNVNAGNSAVITFTSTAGGNYSGSVSLNFTISKATYNMSGISFGNATYTYDGSERTLAISGILPSGVTVTYTNNGHANAGTYTVTASFSGDTVNYNAIQSMTATLTINKATYDMSGISFADATYTYNGTERTLVITGTLPSGVTVSYTTNTLTNAGSIEVTASFAGDTANYNAISDMEATLKIDPKNISGAEITLDTSLTYDGTAQEQTIASVTVDGLFVTYNVSGNVETNAGDYTLTVTGTGNFTGTANADWSIAKRELTADMFQVTGSYFYTGAGREATYTFSDDGGNLTAADFEVSYSNNVNAGNSAVITFTSTAGGNYSGSVSLNFTISKATYNMSGISFGNATYTYDGGEKSLAISGTLPSGVTVTYTNNGHTNAGTYTVTASFTGNANYNDIADMTATLTINKATYDMSGVLFNDAAYTYDGSEKTLVITGTLPSGVTVSYTTNSLTNAGSLEVTASFTGNANYNAIADMTATLTINKATYDMSGVSFEDASYTYDGSEKTLAISGTLPSGVTVSYTANTLTNAGSLEVTASFAGDTVNYNAIADMTATLTIEKAVPAYTLPEGITAITGQTLDEIELPDGWSWVEGSLTLNEAGEYTMQAIYTPDDTDNYDTVTVEISVNVQQATDNTIHYIIWGCIAGIAIIGIVIGCIIVVCVKKRRAKTGK